MKKIYKYILFFLLANIFVSFNLNLNVYAKNKEKTKLEQQLEEQEDKLDDDIGDFVTNDDEIIMDTVESIKNSEYNGFNVENKINSMTNFLKNIVIKSRSTVIILYGLFVILISIYIATIGSRSINKRRHGILLLIGNTLLFLFFINIPLIIIYFSVMKEYTSGISFYSRIIGFTNFLRSNSLIISALLGYLGISKLIVSKNDLPNRQQGQYLFKAAIVILIVLNIVPYAITFII